MTVELKDPSQQIIQSPYSRFLYALNSPETKKKYSKWFEVFLNFIDIEGASLEERLYNFYQRAKSDIDWLQGYHKLRTLNKLMLLHKHCLTLEW